jgi:hypothetical protein
MRRGAVSSIDAMVLLLVKHSVQLEVIPKFVDLLKLRVKDPVTS